MNANVKKLVLGASLVGTMSLMSGCTGMMAAFGGSSKCGSSKCENSEKSAESKCGGSEKKAEPKCGGGKCGSGK